MKLSRRGLLHLTAGAAAAPALPHIARAQAPVRTTWPSRPVRIFVGFPAGGASDTIVRLMAQWLSDRLGQPFLVENLSGIPLDGATLRFA
jgi:tripartite-type tricarboxylate transporter receptor subunit TctC